VYMCVNSAVLREAGVARQRNAEYRNGNIQYRGDVDMSSWLHSSWRQLESNTGMCGRTWLGCLEQHFGRLST